MFENSSHGHVSFFVPKIRWGLPLKVVIYFHGDFCNPKGIFKANHLYMVFFINEVIFCLCLSPIIHAYRVCILLS